MQSFLKCFKRSKAAVSFWNQKFWIQTFPLNVQTVQKVRQEAKDERRRKEREQKKRDDERRQKRDDERRRQRERQRQKEKESKESDKSEPQKIKVLFGPSMAKQPSSTILFYLFEIASR